ncbi:ABC transporter permease [Streptomyces pactum]|uniref:Transport permease protein n=1 Tax=Streptomyces pactum TaxID=68249 RepID=A0ABS0NII7_9ACTN|nr:ABC transporter permease [Streptomyces pactum]MBH5334909.1 ABC transporter permease [Streptomyces pactum]
MSNSYVVSDSVALIGRHMTHLRRMPQKLVSVTVMPIMFVILFGYLFGSSMQVPEGDYHEYIMAGIFVQMMLSSVINTGVGVAEDLNNGLVDRFRSLPMAQSAVLISRTVSDLILNMISCVMMLGIGFLIGWRVDGVLQLLAGFLLLMLLGLVMAWIGTLVGLLLRHVEVVNSVTVMITMPLAFLSSTFYPSSNLPDWLRHVAEWNPVSTVVTAMREVWGNPTGNGSDPAFPLQHPVLVSVVLLSVLLALVVPLANRAYRRAVASSR